MSSEVSGAVRTRAWVGQPERSGAPGPREGHAREVDLSFFSGPQFPFSLETGKLQEKATGSCVL